MQLVLLTVLAVPAAALLGQNPCVSKQSCSECLQTAACAWCSRPEFTAADGSPLPRCNLIQFFSPASRYGRTLRRTEDKKIEFKF